MNMDFHRKLPIPKEVKEEYPVSAEMARVKQRRDSAVKAVFTGESDKFLLIIGPCSADSREPVLEYISRLRRVQDEVADRIIIIPRVYTNKPRTTGEGYKGMLHQPDPFARPDLYRGIIALRELHMTALREYGFTCADEMLYPENHRYLSDLLGYVTVGARSVENQQHRLTASGLNIPVGMKNPTGGDLNVMLNAINTAQHGHTFLYRGWEVESTGNAYAHAILRGSIDHSGTCVPNYGRDTVELLASLYVSRGLKNPAVIIDANHDNSGRDFSKQPVIAREVLAYRRADSALKRLVKGLMIESYLEDGRQSIGDRVFGRSITDPCLGWEKTERLIYETAENV